MEHTYMLRLTRSELDLVHTGLSIIQWRPKPAAIVVPLLQRITAALSRDDSNRVNPRTTIARDVTI